MTQTIKNFLALALLGGVAVLGYFMFIQKDSDSLILGDGGQISSQLLVQASAFIEKRMLIESLTIDTSILVDPRFVDLSNFTTSVPEQSIGKLSLFESAVESDVSQ